MYKNIAIALVIIICSACNKSNRHSACGTQVCTALFAMVSIKFLDKDGNQIIVDNYTAVDLRTNETLSDGKLVAPGIIPPYYAVATDSDLQKLSAEGDDIKVSGTDHATGQTKSTIIKVAGGICNCHVTKISGADKIVFD